MSKRRHRPALIVFVLILAVGFVALGWWQYTRFEAAGGNARNLGYALQWPLFAVAAIWGYKRFVELEEEADLLREAQATDPDGAAALVEAGLRGPGNSGRPTALPDGFLPARVPAPSAAEAPDAGDDRDAHSEYNRLLAELAARDEPQER